MKFCTVIYALASILAFNLEAAPFQNGSFESPGQPAGTGTILSPGDMTITGWTVGGPAGSLQYNGQGFNGQTAFDGANYVTFGHNGATGATLSQTFRRSIP